MFRYRFKSVIKDKGLVFWTLFFPMILSFFFNVALRDVYKVTPVQAQNVGIVAIDNAQAQAFLDSLEADHGLIVQFDYDSRQSALQDLESGKLNAMIAFTDDFEIVVKKDTMMVSVLTNIFNTYNSKQALLQAALLEDPTLVTPEFIDRIINTESFVVNTADDAAGDAFAIHFYTTIAMLCIYAANWGQKSAEYLQADSSALGIRTNVASIPKSKLVFIDISVVFLIFLCEYTIHVGFLKYILKIPFGSNIPLLFGVGIAGGLLSITMGYAISLFVSGKSEHHAILISGIGVFSGFLSGMMSIEIKTFVEKFIPFINVINPATLITDSLRYLTLTGYEHRIYMNMGIMFLASAVFALLAYQKLKGGSYDRI